MDKIDYGYDECFKVKSNEKSVKITQDAIDYYESIIDFMPIQSPINKLIDSDTPIYISILLAKNIMNLINHIENDRDLSLIRHDNMNNYNHLMIKKYNTYANLLVYKCGELNYMVIRIFKDKNKADKDFLNKEYNERIDC